MSIPSTDRLTDMFADSGLRCTRQRRALFDALMATKSHPTADMLYRQVISDCPGMSLATVYNTLEAFVKAGLVLKIPGTRWLGPLRWQGGWHPPSAYRADRGCGRLAG
ncbi:MAG: transcriptional repressor [Phycisphaerales bacterium]|nr:transcriptional repressor [Phycisphaerales bacterium]